MSDKTAIRNVWKWLAAALLLAGMVWAVRSFCVGSYRISTHSMRYTLDAGDRILVNKLPIKGNPGRNRVVLFRSSLLQDSIAKPLFLSRCIGMPGDTIAVSAGGYVVNGKAIPHSPRAVQSYFFPFADEALYEKVATKLQLHTIERTKVDYGFTVDLATADYNRLKNAWGEGFSLTPAQQEPNAYTLILPRKNRPYRLTDASLIACREAILREAGGKAVFREGKLFVDGRESSFFVFQQDYYWMLSDNPDEAIDSRHLGLIPADHLVGNAWFCWYSKDKKRRFKSIH